MINRGLVTFKLLLLYTILLLALLSGCGSTSADKTFVLDPTITYPEERNVLVAVPIIPVEIDSIK